MPRGQAGETWLTERITLADNLLEDINGSTWAGAGWFLILSGVPPGLVVDHNTIFQSGNLISVGGTPGTGFVYTNNISPHNTYGVKRDARATGLDTLQTFFPGYVFRRNRPFRGPSQVEGAPLSRGRCRSPSAQMSSRKAVRAVHDSELSVKPRRDTSPCMCGGIPASRQREQATAVRRYLS